MMIKKLIVLFNFTMIITLLSFSLFISKSKAETIPEIDISLSPEKILFTLTNLKPGDWSEQTLTIKNTGKQDFNYQFSSQLKNGSKKFYKELFLKVSSRDEILFEGKMKDLKKLHSRLIAQSNSEQLFFKVKVPEELGNEFQGLDCQVEFKFYVEGTLGGVLPVDGPKLPETGTNMFNIFAAGAVLLLTGLLWQFVLLFRRRKMAKEV